ncbi:MAG: exodeoxyribonuclease VII large subunit [Clostridiales bacterium]|jgi:exodeoxyribonuclease VII large subunit|nr:exodeoxyribonuclease VII large subunit [Clostridiales bacterium]
MHRILTVTQLNEYMHTLIGRDPVLKSLRVQGEISGFKHHTSGHMYFTLKDGGALVRCVMFRSAAQTLHFAPRDGMRVVVTGEASLYVRDGQFQLYVQAMQQDGEGELYGRYLLLKTRLEAKGYFDASIKKPIPYLPKCVGIVTSPTGAALQDMLNIIRRRFPAMHICVCPVPVQGPGAAQEIAAAILRMNEAHAASVLIVGRGGGSLEDLWAFNEECVARAIYKSHIPVISAVGHETDHTIADFVADLRAPTPSAAAELCVPEYAALVQTLDIDMERLRNAYAANVHSRKEYIKLLMQSRGFFAVESIIAKERRALTSAFGKMRMLMDARIVSKTLLVNTLMERLNALSPAGLLARGLALVSDENGRALFSVQMMEKGMAVKLRMHDGEADAIIQTINSNK